MSATTPESGHAVDLLAADENQLRVLRWSQISVVMQSAMNALNPVLSIGSQLTDVLQAHVPGMSKAGRRARAAELLDHGRHYRRTGSAATRTSCPAACGSG